MQISYNTLKNIIDFTETPEELGKLLTATGLEVEGIHEQLSVPGGLKGLLIGEVLECTPHPNADKLRCTKVDIGTGELQDIVCGAPNVASGQKVIVATVGATLYPTEGEPFEIKKAKIRGEASNGMLCAEDEIGLGKSHAGIMVLDTTLPNGTPAATYFNLESDYVIEIGLTPNRADAASHFGVARDIKAVNGNAIKLPSTIDLPYGSEASSIHLSVKNTEACPRFCGIEIKGVTVKESPTWLKNFLTSIGVNSINNLVDISNYICHFLGQPMHIFDADKIDGAHIIVTTPTAGTPITTLDGVERKLTGTDLAICDANEKPLAIAGVFGGEHSGVTANTKNVFLEVAYFHPDWIRRTATAHSLKTDASFRYERGTDPEMPPYAIKYAANLILELAGGVLSSQVIENYPAEVPSHKFRVKFKNIDRLIGKALGKEKIKSILTSLDIEIKSETDEALDLEVPAYRVDVTREADIVEEILRIYGFDNIELSEHLSSSYISEFPVTDSDTQQLKIAELLAANGFNEIQTLSIVKPAQNAVLGDTEHSDVKLLNPLSEELSVLRNSLFFSGLQTLSYNINRRAKDLKMYEFGRVYGKTQVEDKNKFFDKSVLGMWMTGQKTAETWKHKSESLTFFDLKNEVLKVLSAMRVLNIKTAESDEELFDYGITYLLNNRVVASIGQVKSKYAKFADVKQTVFYAELDWAYILKKYSSKIGFVEISKYPEVRRDLSLVINDEVNFEQIKTVAQKTEKKLLKSVDVFDIYKGDKLGADKKSYSVSFILQDDEKTLNDSQIDKTMEKLITVFEKELGALIRR